MVFLRETTKNKNLKICIKETKETKIVHYKIPTKQQQKRQL